MIWPGKDVARFIEVISDRQIQPNGVDLTIGEIFIFESRGVLSENKVLPAMRRVEPDNDGYYTLEQGCYLVRYREIVQIPKNAIGLVFPRSSLQRMGAMIYTSVWDSGYRGRGVGLLAVLNKNGIKIHKDARICQIIFITAKSSRLYSGEYYLEGIKQDT